MNRLNVLLAEDSQGDVLLVREALAKHDIPNDLYVVGDGGEALEFISRMGQADTPCPDLILLDLNLPKADGLAVLAEFRKHRMCVHTPVIVLSSSDAPRDRDGVKALGVSRYFRKPLDLDEFLELGALVREVVQESSLAVE
jgi:CheY-like chemotaxis protein